MFEKIAWIIITNLALYARTLRFKFVSDDFSVSMNPPVAKNWWHKQWLRFTGAGKWKATSVHFFMGRALIEKGMSPEKVKPFGLYGVFAKTEELEHLLAILIHTAIGISIYFAFGANQMSFIAALLYSFNPVNNQGTIWPGGRGYALPVLSIMLAVSIPLLSPVLLYFCTWYTIGFHGVLGLIGTPKLGLLIMVPFLWLVHGRKFTKSIKYKSSTESYAEDKKYDINKVVIAIKTFGFYLVLCLTAFRITFYHNFLQSLAGSMAKKWRSVWDRYFWVGLFSMIGIVYYSITHWGPLAQALLAFLVTMLPYCNIVRANQEIAERFAALPNAFLMAALAYIIAPYPVICAAFLVLYATRTYYTVGMYKDEYNITEVAVIEDPHAWWAWHCRAMKRWDTQSYKEALILWVMAKIISPKEFKVLMNIATCLRLIKNDREADEYLELARQNMVAGQEAVSLDYIEQHKQGNFPILL